MRGHYARYCRNERQLPPRLSCAPNDQPSAQQPESLLQNQPQPQANMVLKPVLPFGISGRSGGKAHAPTPTVEAHAFVKKVLTRRKQKQAGANTNYRLLTDPIELKAWHARFGHCDLSRLVATLRERQVGVKEEVRKKVWRECELCEDRNAVNRTPHAVLGRREKEAKEYGQLAYCDIGQLVGYPFLVIVQMHSREIDVMGLNAKSDMTDHCVRFNVQNRILLSKPHRQIVIMRSDNENVLRLAKMKATMPYTHFDESAKYHSPSQGPAEAAVKMIKRLARTMMKEKRWPLAVFSHLWEGLAETYIALHMNELGTSPYYKKNSQHPPLKFMCGDKVIFTPHRVKTAKKTEELPGKRGWYISRPSPHAVRVLEIWGEGPNDFTVQTVHPVDVYQSRKGTLATWGYEGVDEATQLLLAGVTDTGLEP
uniref:Integrase catalytic domain-containing protein n=1 Tax=Chromera velia CCMP2878 TaxID=1169474 RepID=A0A0G4GPX8_9ALVE|eukprot:Cvel_22866.t1-p1 / transcript=Cvel_22866.t1 / gene=Cvel_22866 / organism=Chromera_velia_CCMP2878 / gene_product=hypothetical protein / transcript_product=hypothetical protein / location=Cvel_scaffold2295:10534-12551(-) / protein_length=424 / sequence_SO=supercontig / SO=protein_coding / is_pseudo=false